MTRLELLFAIILILMSSPVALAHEDHDHHDSHKAKETDHKELTFDLWEGLRYRHGDLDLHLGALLAIDWRQLDERNTRDTDPFIDRAQIRVDGQLLPWLSFRVFTDLRGIDTRKGLEEAWLSATSAKKWWRLTAGMLRIPIGIEHSYQEDTLPFVEYGSPAFLSGRHDWGLRVDGELLQGLLSYDVTAALGQGYDLLGERRKGRQVSGRLVLYPFRLLDQSVSFQGLRFPLLSGLFASFGAHVTWDSESRVLVKNSFRNTLFTTPVLKSDRTVFRHFGLGWDLGPIRISHEVVQGSLLGLQALTADVDLENQLTAYAFNFAVRLTGEAYDSRPFRQRDMTAPKPRTPLFAKDSTEKTGLGLLELAIRYTNADIDRDLIELGFTNEAVSSQEFRTFSAALNWYPIRSLRLTTQVTRTIADSSPQTFDSHGRDTSFLVRLQLSF